MFWCSGPPKIDPEVKTRDANSAFISGCLPILGSVVGTDEVAKSDFVRQKVTSFAQGFQLIRNEHVSAQAALLMLSHCLLRL